VQAKVVNRELFNELTHGDFEYPVHEITGYFYKLTDYPPSAGYWNTTHDYGNSNNKKLLEIGTNNNYGAYTNHGSRVAELSPYLASSIYEEIATVPGKIYEWSLDHAARYKSIATSPQVMAAVIGAAVNEAADYAAYGIGGSNRWVDDAVAPPDYVYPYGKNYDT
jgi:hypothetical protein